MKAMQSFLTFFYILDQGYEQCQEANLGKLLGAISPEFWEDGRPMDQAIFNDWQKINSCNTINKHNIIKGTYTFLTYYEKQFGFKFPKTKRWLLSLNEQAIVENAIVKMQEMYQKYEYDN